MPDDVAAGKAIKELDRGEIDGQEIGVMKARPREQKFEKAIGERFLTL